MTKARDLSAFVSQGVSTTELGYLDGVTSAVQTQLNQKPEFTAGKNKIINGDCLINQRNFSSQTLTTETSVFLVDRIVGVNIIGGSSAFSVQQFTLGSAPVSGYEAKQFLRVTTSGQSSTLAGTMFSQGIESVRTFAGQTITVSFWAKASSGTPNIGVEVRQFFGSGGSPSSAVEQASKVAITTGWVRYSKTFTLASISGKTLGTSGNDSLQINLWVSAGTDFNSRTDSLGIQSNTFDIWGMQVEAGSVATPFTPAGGGNPQAELALCQRYYWRNTSDSVYTAFGSAIWEPSSSIALLWVDHPVVMRTVPTSIDWGGGALMVYDGAGAIAVNSISIGSFGSKKRSRVNLTLASSATANRPYELLSNANSTAFLGFSAEL